MLLLIDFVSFLFHHRSASSWRRIGERLPNAARQGEYAFPLDDQFLDELGACSKSDRERLIALLLSWRKMSKQHTWGMLSDTLFDCDNGRIAEDAFTNSTQGGVNLKESCITARPLRGH